MLYNSVFFIMPFLPLALFGWFLLQRLGNPVFAKVFLIGMSFWFYGYYNVWYLGVLLFSIAVNQICSLLFERFAEGVFRKTVFAAGLFLNIGLIFYFKYWNFFLENCNFFLHTDFSIEQIALPLGISFFTFQQISFLVDRYRKQAPCYSWVDYACFVSFFPQLVAGPIVLHSELIPQLMKRKNRRPDAEHLFDGISLFILGLGKKVLLADFLALYVEEGFGHIAGLDAPAAWLVSIFYLLELYFDFSGYTDMSRGIAKMFGFRLPENFDSPLLAVSVRDFWHRWHITLSHFLATYIYIPLGGNRKGKLIKCRNIMIVFLVSGLWHGADWTFVIWGLLHGLAMVGEMLFEGRLGSGQRVSADGVSEGKIRRLFTGIFLVLTFAIFRSDSLGEAGKLFQKLFAGGASGAVVRLGKVFQIPETWAIRRLLETRFLGLLNPFYLFCMFFMLLISHVLVNAPKAEDWIEKSGRTYRGLLLLAVIFVWAFLSLSQVSTFLYFDF